MAEKVAKTDQKTVEIEIIKFHPLVANEVGEKVTVLQETADEWVGKKYAKLV